MKKIYLICLLSFVVCMLTAQTTKNYKIKAQYMYGTILRHNKHLEDLVKGPPIGGEIAVEFQTMGKQSWQQYTNFPVIGVGTVFMDYDNPEMLGQGIALYPYLNIPVVRTKYFNLNIKPGAGIAFLNKRYSNTPHQEGTLNGANGAIGSVINVFLTCGGNIEIPIAYGFSLTADYAWNHFSNGSVVQPNSGINMLNGYFGLKYSPNYRYYEKPERKNTKDVPHKFYYELTISGGIRQLYYQDNKYYPTGSIAFSISRPMSNWYRMGLGADVFYDGVFGAINVPGEGRKIDTKYLRTYIELNELKNKIRAGICWQHELLLGRLTAGFHLGIYLYDPIKKLEPYTEIKNNGPLNKPLIYKYDIQKEDGWFYARAIVKYTITEHLYAAIGLKTHLQKAEFIEWGLGWRF